VLDFLAALFFEILIDIALHVICFIFEAVLFILHAVLTGICGL